MLALSFVVSWGGDLPTRCRSDPGSAPSPDCLSHSVFGDRARQAFLFKSIPALRHEGVSKREKRLTTRSQPHLSDMLGTEEATGQGYSAWRMYLFWHTDTPRSCSVLHMLV